MNSSPLKLKNTKNWFAAGSEVQQAMAALTDGAFKVFVHVCLNAERSTGILPTTQSELARNLNKSHGAIRKYLSEMEKSWDISKQLFTIIRRFEDPCKSLRRSGLMKTKMQALHPRKRQLIPTGV